MTLFKALTSEHLTVSTGNIAGNLTKIFPKSQMPGGLPGGGGGGGMGGFGIDQYIKQLERRSLKKIKQGFTGIRTCDLCGTGAMRYQLSYEATHLLRTHT